MTCPGFEPRYELTCQANPEQCWIIVGLPGNLFPAHSCTSRVHFKYYSVPYYINFHVYTCMCSSLPSVTRAESEKCLFNDFKTLIDLRRGISSIAVSADSRSVVPAVNTAMGFGSDASGDFAHISLVVIVNAGETMRGKYFHRELMLLIWYVSLASRKKKHESSGHFALRLSRYYSCRKLAVVCED